MPTFKAIVIEKGDGGQKVRLTDFDEANLMEGDVTIRVEWSTVNYKDGLAHNLIASDRVEGTPVRSTDGSTIGTIERLMIDKLTGKVAHAVLRSTGVGMAKRHLLIRWSRLTYDRTLAAYHVDVTERELSALSYESDIDWGDRGREIERYDDDRVKVYWGIAETW